MKSQTECAFVTDGYPASPPTTNIAEPENDALRTLLALHAIALGAMSHGLCVFDAEGRVALFNRRLMEIFGLSSEIMCVGMSFRALLELGVMRGHYTRGAFGKTWSECKKQFEQCKPFVLHHEFANGNLVRSHFRPVAAGGWAVIYEETASEEILGEIEAQTANRLSATSVSTICRRGFASLMQTSVCYFVTNSI